MSKGGSVGLPKMRLSTKGPASHAVPPLAYGTTGYGYYDYVRPILLH
ncbi:MAG: hypothetical protein MZV63_11560 [Marinilabiliales bacterium]|nr:hypothetical protein [Marinilabiliales bacterium]